MTTQSIFTMDMVNQVLAMDITSAKKFALQAIADAEGPKPQTKAKARNVVIKSRDTKKLAFAMSSWILAHPTEGLKVIELA